MNLQQFVTVCIESIGGVVSAGEYALIDAIIPDEYADRFGGRTEIRMAFDVEVASENPDAEFITFGSPTLDQLLEIARTKPIFSLRYAIIDRIKPANPEQMIKEALPQTHVKIRIEKQRTVATQWSCFVFRIEYHYDEFLEELHTVFVNPILTKIEPGIDKARLFYQDQPVAEYEWLIPRQTVSQSYLLAYKNAGSYAQKQAEKRTRRDLIEKEIERLHYYYQDLYEENEVLLLRHGLSEERKNERIKKRDSFQLEEKRQIEEIKRKMTVQSFVYPEHAYTYIIPMIEYTAQVVSSKYSKSHIFYYNPLCKRIDYNAEDT